MAGSSASLVGFSPYRYAGQVIGTVHNLISPRCEFNGLSTLLNVPRPDGDGWEACTCIRRMLNLTRFCPVITLWWMTTVTLTMFFFASYGAPNSPVFDVTVAASVQFFSTCDLYSLCEKSIEGFLWKEQGLLKRTCIRILSLNFVKPFFSRFCGVSVCWRCNFAHSLFIVFLGQYRLESRLLFANFSQLFLLRS